MPYARQSDKLDNTCSFGWAVGLIDPWQTKVMSWAVGQFMSILWTTAGQQVVGQMRSSKGQQLENSWADVHVGHWVALLDRSYPSDPS